MPTILIVFATAINNNPKAEDTATAVGNVTAYTIIAIAIQSSGATISIILERVEKLKYALNVMGCRYTPFWIANFAYDFIFSLFIDFVFLVCIYIL